MGSPWRDQLGCPVATLSILDMQGCPFLRCNFFQKGLAKNRRPQITTQCMQECLKRGIPVSYFSKGGNYFGRLQSTGHINVERQRMQCSLYESGFAIELSRRIIRAKLKNQAVVLRRYEKSRNIPEMEQSQHIKRYRENVERAETIEEIMGYEGQAAKSYFEGLSKIINQDFKFKGRSRRPPP